jgi:superfamily II DNA/RNA helicase
METNYENKKESISEYNSENEPEMETNFENLNLSENLIKGVYIYGFKKPSKIQVKGIQAINTGKDCIIQSQSGTGKTATYLLGILNKIEENDKCQAIIITPTRELATQVFKVATEICKFNKIKIEICTGGTSINMNRSNLKKTNLVIGTIGRINHMVQENRINLYNVKLLALDEADDILSEGVSKELSMVFNKLPTGTQICLISATLSNNVFDLSKEFMHQPLKILLKKNDIPVDLIKQFYIDVEIEELKFEVLLDLYNLISTSQAIIFCNTIRKVEWLTTNLEEKNFSITSIHGKMTSTERTEVVKDFRNGKTRILITTDLLSRGIDIPHVNLVINYDLPPNKETYIHRIGRCGRFGKKGVAIALVKMKDQYDIKCINRMKTFYNMNIDELPEDIETYL